MKNLLDTSKLPPGFNPYQQWDTVTACVDFCKATEHPKETLKAIVLANIDHGEPDFVSEVVLQYFDSLCIKAARPALG